MATACTHHSERHRISRCNLSNALPRGFRSTRLPRKYLMPILVGWVQRRVAESRRCMFLMAGSSARSEKPHTANIATSIRVTGRLGKCSVWNEMPMRLLTSGKNFTWAMKSSCLPQSHLVRRDKCKWKDSEWGNQR